jgi:hypothetical protein
MGEPNVNGSTIGGLSRLREQWRDPLLTALTVLLVVLMFVLAPLEAVGLTGAQDIGFAIAVLVIGAAIILSGNPIAIIAMLIAIGLVLAAGVVRFQQHSDLGVGLKASGWIMMGFALMWVISRAVFAPGFITYHRVMGAILLYLTIGWTFGGLFTLVGLLAPSAFTGATISDSPALASTMVYFSFGTLTTAGSGTIAPLHPIARSLCNLEAMVGQLYPATLLARLVTLAIESEAKR